MITKLVYKIIILSVLFLLFFILPINAKGKQEDNSESDYTVPENLYNLLSANPEPYILIDVRTAEEYASGHIPSAINIPYDIISDNMPTENSDDLIIVYCRSGRRSGIAQKAINDLGFTNIYDFGGVSRWSFSKPN